MNADQRALVAEARANVQRVRADPDAKWPPGALETAEARLTRALDAGPETPAMTDDERALVVDALEHVRIVRADPEAKWPPGALETADRSLTEALGDVAAVIALQGVAVTYQGHGQARDIYLGRTDEEVQWGPHDSWPLLAPSDGRVELYDSSTPLPGAAVGAAAPEDADPEYLARRKALFDGWVCRVPAESCPPTSVPPASYSPERVPREGVPPAAAITPAAGVGQTMHVAVFWPDQLLQTSGGGLRAIWFGHVRGNVRTGRVRRGDQFAETGASGIQFERAGVSTARAAHAHACASATGQLSPNGDVDGLLACEAMGWRVQFIGSNGPGPTQYQTGLYCAGRLLTDFHTAHKPLPRVAPD